MTSYNSQIGEGKYNIQLETTNATCYDFIQTAIRLFMDKEAAELHKELDQKFIFDVIDYSDPKQWRMTTESGTLTDKNTLDPIYNNTDDIPRNTEAKIKCPLDISSYQT